MAFDFSTLITDRSQGDLDALRSLLSTPKADWTAEQLAEFNLAKSKGAYNYTDLNRATACMDYLNEVLTGLGYVTGYVPVEVPHGGSGSRLPEGYTELEYIKSTGTQWIDTGLVPKNTLRIVMEIDLTSSNGYKGVFGGRDSGSSASFVLWQTSSGFRFDFSGKNTSISQENGGKFTFDADGGSFSINGVLVASTAGSSFTSTASFVLFSATTGEGTSDVDTRMAIGDLSLCQIYDNGDLIRDYVPCTKPSGQVGLYDLETEEFYGNSGTGSFIAGPGAAPPPDPSKDPYTWYEDDTPTPTTLTAYLANVTALRGVLTLGEDTPEIPGDMVGLTLAEANAIEQILDALNDYLEAMQEIYLRSGMVWAISGGPGFYFTN